MSGSALLPVSQFARDVREGLGKPGQKELSPTYFYDDLGSALFEAITLLPEYGLTRADERLLQQNALEISRHIRQPALVAELGSGSGRKTRWLLEALSAHGALSYCAIDISAAALARCRQELSGVVANGVTVLEMGYLEGLREVASRRRPGQSILVLFLGSTIGNFSRSDAAEFLAAVAGLLLPGDTLLLGTDLVKPIPQMLLAYDDPAGVTAAFNLNVLSRINRELGADFVLRSFVHEARYDECESRIEMHLVSRREQAVSIPAAGITVNLRRGESIFTEASHKFTLAELPHMAARTGFVSTAYWTDLEWPFAENLWTVRRR